MIWGADTTSTCLQRIQWVEENAEATQDNNVMLQRLREILSLSLIR